jgi:hypothetical protein
MGIASHERPSNELGYLTKVLDVEVLLIGHNVWTVKHIHLLAMEHGHSIGTDAPFECDACYAEQQRLCWIGASQRLVSGHLGAYELASVIDKREECAIAIHLIHAMLDERVQCDVAAGDWAGRRALGDIEGK